MAHARRRSPEVRAKLEIADGVWAYLNDQEIPDDDSETKFGIIMLEAGDGEALRELWGRARGEVITGWTKDRPGTRPAAWWRLDAPRQLLGTHSGAFYDGKLPQPREQLSGAGCDASLISAYMPSYKSGLPTSWAGFEASDPPVFESQAAYLKRHNLLTAGELRVLTASDYERTEALSAECEVLSASEKWVRERIPAARRSMGFHDVEQARPN
jgi:hypothetical protein